MEKLIFTYLNTTYPNAYRKITKFGYDMRGFSQSDMDWYYVREEIILTIMKLFSYNFTSADDILEEWLRNLRVLDEGKLSESEKVSFFLYHSKITY